MTKNMTIQIFELVWFKFLKCLVCQIDSWYPESPSGARDEGGEEGWLFLLKKLHILLMFTSIHLVITHYIPPKQRIVIFLCSKLSIKSHIIKNHLF